MNSQYKSIHQVADQLNYKLHDCIDNAQNDMSNQILELGRSVREDIESDKSPRSVEARIEDLKRLLNSLRAESTTTMSPQDAQMLNDAYERLRRQLRELPNY